MAVKVVVVATQRAVVQEALEVEVVSNFGELVMVALEYLDKETTEQQEVQQASVVAEAEAEKEVMALSVTEALVLVMDLVLLVQAVVEEAVKTAVTHLVALVVVATEVEIKEQQVEAMALPIKVEAVVVADGHLAEALVVLESLFLNISFNNIWHTLHN